jgi:hypothetical protein
MSVPAKQTNVEIANQARATFKQLGISESKLHKWYKKYSVIYPWDSDYNTIRLNYNRSPQYFPLMLIQVTKAKNIKSMVKRCQKYKIPFSIRGGGHDPLGYSLSSGVVFNLAALNKVKLHKCKSVARDHSKIVSVGAGVRIGDVVNVISKQGYAFASGNCTTVGMGLALGSGFGFLSRRYGLTIDTLKSVKIILANGKCITASNTEHPDLFWALRGAGSGNFGIITEYTFKVFYLPQVTIATLGFPVSQFTEFMLLWQQWCDTVDLDLTTAVWANNQNITLECQLDCTSLKQGASHETAKAKMLKLIDPFLKMNPETKIWTTSYLDAVKFFSTPRISGISALQRGPQFQFYHRNAYIVEPLSQKDFEVIAQALEKAPENCIIDISGLGGKVKDPTEQTSFAWRDAKYWLQIRASWNNFPDQQERTKWADQLYLKLWPSICNPNTSVPRVYVGFKQQDLGDKYTAAYWGDAIYPKLQAIKAKYDPQNVFNYPQSIKP